MLRSLARFTAITGLLLVAARVSSAQEAPLGERIGPTLEASERAYFGLFPTIYAPLPWDLVVRPDSVLVQREGRTLRVLTPAEAAQLARLVNTFEDYPSIPANPNWSATQAFRIYIDAKTLVPSTATASVVRVETAEGSYSGFALYASDSVLVLAPEVLPREASLPGAYAVPRANILALSQQQPTSWQKWGTLVSLGIGTALGAAFAPDLDRRSSAGFGALIGLTAGTLTSQQSQIGKTAISLSSIDSLALFNRSRPPELPDVAGAITRATSFPAEPNRQRKRSRPFEWVSIGIHGSTSVSDDAGEPVQTVVAQSLIQPQRFRNSIQERNRDPLSAPFRLDVSVRPIKWFRAGVFVGAFASGDSLRNLPGREQQLRSAGRVRPYAEAILPLARSGDQRVEVFAGGGRQSYAMRIIHNTPPTDVQDYPVSPARQEISNTGSAWFYTAGIEIHSTRYSSLFVRRAWYPIPPLIVPPFRYAYARDRDLTVRLVDAHEVDFSYTEFTIGARFHF